MVARLTHAHVAVVDGGRGALRPVRIPLRAQRPRLLRVSPHRRLHRLVHRALEAVLGEDLLRERNRLLHRGRQEPLEVQVLHVV